MGTSPEARVETEVDQHMEALVSPCNRATGLLSRLPRALIFPSILPPASFVRSPWVSWHSLRVRTVTREGLWKCFVTVKHSGRSEALLLLQLAQGHGTAELCLSQMTPNPSGNYCRVNKEYHCSFKKNQSLGLLD